MRITATVRLETPIGADVGTDNLIYNVTPDALKARIAELDSGIDEVAAHLIKNGAKPESVRVTLAVGYRYAHVQGEGETE